MENLANNENLEIDFSSTGETATSTSKWVYLLAYTVLFVLIVLSFINLLENHSVLGHFNLIDYPLHSTFEIIGAVVAIFVSLIPIQFLMGYKKPSFVFVSLGFFSMGLWDLAHAFIQAGDSFVFTHSTAMLFGGLFFALSCLNWSPYVLKIKNVLFLIILGSFLFFNALDFWGLLPFPTVIENKQFNNTSNLINLISGYLFSVSALFYSYRFFKNKNLGVLTIVFVSVLSAVSGFSFQHSIIWTDSWWFWHALRLISFIVVFIYLFWRIIESNNQRTKALFSLNQQHLLVKESEERFDLTMKATNQGIWDWDIPNDLVYFSPLWKQQVGYLDHELENKFDIWISLLHPEDKDRCVNAVNDFIQNPTEKFVLEFRFRHKDGHYVWIHNESAVIKDKEGNVIRMFGAHTDITQQKKTEEAVIQSENKFRNIFEHSPLGKSITGLDGSLKVNSNFITILGYSELEFKEKKWQDITHPDDIAESELVIKKLLNSEAQSLRFEKRYLHKDGYYLWTEVNTTLSRDDEGKPEFFITSISDITERKEMLAKIVESENKFKKLFNSVSIPLAYVKEDGKMDYLNDRFVSLFGYDLEDVPDLDTWWEKAYPDEEYRNWAQDNWTRVVEDSMKTGADIESETYNVTCKSGEIRQIIIAGITMENDFLATFIDVTEQRKAEKVILQEKEFSESVINALPGIFYLFDENGKFVKWNKAMSKLSGIPYDEFVNKSPLDFIAPKDRMKIQKAIQTSFEKGEVFVEADFLTKTGQPNIPFYFTGIKIILNDEPLLLGVGIDISQRIQAEEQRKKALVELEKSNKELEQFAYVASHDLQEPLRMISSYTQLLQKRYQGQLDERADKYIYYAVDGANRMQQLIIDLLEFSRVSTQGEDFVTADLNETLKVVQNNLKFKITETKARIDVKNLPQIKGDERQLERLFQNLIANAIKFSRPNVIPEIEISAEEQQKDWLIRVKDNGIGIDQKFKDKVFVIFQRLHGAGQYQGTGIGLTVCKKIAERHGGKIWFESKIGEGTEFFITFKK